VATGQKVVGYGRGVGRGVPLPTGVWSGEGAMPSAQKICRLLLLALLTRFALPGILHYTASHGRIPQFKMWGQDEAPKAPRIETLQAGNGDGVSPSLAYPGSDRAS